MNFNIHSAEDAKLLMLIKHSNKRAFNTLYERYWEDVFKSVQYILQDSERSMDVVQEIFIWFWENREKWEVKNPKLYLISAAKYKVANLIRHRKVKSEVFQNLKLIHSNVVDLSVEEKLEVEELQKVILDFVETLPPRCSEVFKLSRMEHYSNREIAEKLNISEKTVENQITIALKKLKTNLGQLSVISIFFF